MKRNRKTRLFLCLTLVALAALLLAACGEEESTDAASPTSDVAAGVEAAQTEVEANMGIPVWAAPGDPIDAKAIGGGKTFFSMPVSSEIPYNVAMEAAVEAAVQSFGGEYVGWPNQGKTEQYVQGMEYAISQKVDVITLTSGFDVRLVQPQIEKATEAGIVVVASTFGGTTQGYEPYVSVAIPMQYEKAAELMTDYAIWKTEGNLNALVITATDVYSSKSMIPTIEDTLATNCPTAKTKWVDVQVPNWATQIQTEVQSALVADPDINYVICLYDSMTTYVWQGLLAAGKNAGDVGITGFNGTPGPMQLVAEGKSSIDVGQDILWAGYATIDVGLRVLSDTPPNSGLVNENIPLRVFDETNAAEAGDPPSLTAGYGTVAVDGYSALWGLE